MFKNLIGSQIISVDDTTITIHTPDGKIRHLDIVEDEGDCCGFNEVGIQIFEEQIKRNPVITDVKYNNKVRCNDDKGEEDIATLTFYGEYAPMVTIDSLSSSGSGWSYGACVTLVCRETNDSECLTAW